MASQEMMAFVQTAFPFFLMGALFYFLVWRPQRKEQDARKSLLNSLKEGDEVVTIGGICGTIVSLTEKTVLLKVAENTEINFVRNAVSSVKKH